MEENNEWVDFKDDKPKNEYWITNSRFKFIALLLFLMFLVFMLLIYLKADEITKDPCSICAKNQGEKVVCTTGMSQLISRTYDPNGSIINKDGGNFNISYD